MAYATFQVLATGNVKMTCEITVLSQSVVNNTTNIKMDFIAYNTSSTAKISFPNTSVKYTVAMGGTLGVQTFTKALNIALDAKKNKVMFSATHLITHSGTGFAANTDVYVIPITTQTTGISGTLSASYKASFKEIERKGVCDGLTAVDFFKQNSTYGIYAPAKELQYTAEIHVKKATDTGWILISKRTITPGSYIVYYNNFTEAEKKKIISVLGTVSEGALEGEVRIVTKTYNGSNLLYTHISGVKSIFSPNILTADTVNLLTYENIKNSFISLSNTPTSTLPYIKGRVNTGDNAFTYKIYICAFIYPAPSGYSDFLFFDNTGSTAANYYISNGANNIFYANNKDSKNISYFDYINSMFFNSTSSSEYIKVETYYNGQYMGFTTKPINTKLPTKSPTVSGNLVSYVDPGSCHPSEVPELENKVFNRITQTVSGVDIYKSNLVVVQNISSIYFTINPSTITTYYGTKISSIELAIGNHKEIITNIGTTSLKFIVPPQDISTDSYAVITINDTRKTQYVTNILINFIPYKKPEATFIAKREGGYGENTYIEIKKSSYSRLNLQGYSYNTTTKKYTAHSIVDFNSVTDKSSGTPSINYMQIYVKDRNGTSVAISGDSTTLSESELEKISINKESSSFDTTENMLVVLDNSQAYTIYFSFKDKYNYFYANQSIKEGIALFRINNRNSKVLANKMYATQIEAGNRITISPGLESLDDYIESKKDYYMSLVPNENRSYVQTKRHVVFNQLANATYASLNEIVARNVPHMVTDNASVTSRITGIPTGARLVIETGRVSVGGVASDYSTLTVPFKYKFLVIPRIIATAVSTVSGTNVTGIGTNNITTSSFEMRIWRNSTTKTGIDYVAIGYITAQDVADADVPYLE